MAITDKIYVKNHRQLGSQLETSIPKRAFAGATLDQLYLGENLAHLDDATQDRVVAFAGDFLDCDCKANPHCGHPEEKFIRYLLELRTGGLEPGAMVDAMSNDYLVYAYPGDLFSFLDDAIRTLEAVERLADVEGNDAAVRRARERSKQLIE